MVLSNIMIALNIPYTKHMIVKSCMSYCYSKFYFYIFYLRCTLHCTTIKPKKLSKVLVSKPF